MGAGQICSLANRPTWFVPLWPDRISEPIEPHIATHPYRKLTNGQITGRVYTSDGKPVPNQDVELADAEGNGLAELHAETDEEGQYHFSGGHPGQFVIGVNLDGVPNAKSPT